MIHCFSYYRRYSALQIFTRFQIDIFYKSTLLFSYFSGQAINRLHIRSDSEETDKRPPLPDIIPFPRDRSVSLPDVPAFRRQQVGKELRRISDEFFSESKSAKPQRVNINSKIA